MLNRIIIDIQDNTSIDRALDAVRLVVLEGRVSETSVGVKHFCWATIFHKSGIAVYTRTKKKNQTSNSFFVRTEQVSKDA